MKGPKTDLIFLQKVPFLEGRALPFPGRGGGLTTALDPQAGATHITLHSACDSVCDVLRVAVVGIKAGRLSHASPSQSPCKPPEDSPGRAVAWGLARGGPCCSGVCTGSGLTPGSCKSDGGGRGSAFPGAAATGLGGPAPQGSLHILTGLFSRFGRGIRYPRLGSRVRP